MEASSENDTNRTRLPKPSKSFDAAMLSPSQFDFDGSLSSCNETETGPTPRKPPAHINSADILALKITPEALTPTNNTRSALRLSPGVPVSPYSTSALRPLSKSFDAVDLDGDNDDDSHHHYQSNRIHTFGKTSPHAMSPRTLSRRFPRRASTGGTMSASRFAAPLAGASQYFSPSGRSSTCDDDSTINSASMSMSYHHQQQGANASDEPSFMKALRRPSMTKLESESKLKSSLSLVNEYKDRDDKIDMLRERFSSSKRSLKNAKRRVARRSSLSSYHSAYEGSVSSYSMNEAFSALSQNNSALSSDVSLELTECGFEASRRSDNSFHMSSETIPVANIIREDDRRRKITTKTDQIIESLVWFSFHTPRAVLEDLITHEIELWRLEQQHRIRLSSHSKSRRSGRTKQQQQQHKQQQTSAAAATDSSLDDDDGSFSSLSDEEVGASDVFDGNFSESIIRLQGMNNGGDFIKLPKAVQRNSALLFVDMSGFTKLSTMLDVESLSKVINSYFDMIVSEVIQHGGDCIAFAGDAFFAEWKVVSEHDGLERHLDNPLADLNASLALINEITWDDDIPKLATCVLSAVKCSIAIVQKFSDYHVTSASANTSEAMLNVHCGVGVGPVVGLHVGDYKEGQEEDGVELRREFLLLGDPIEQVSKAADLATDGEVFASPEAMQNLTYFCNLSRQQRESEEPTLIAARDHTLVEFNSSVPVVSTYNALPAALLPYESLRMHCRSLNHTALARLHLQMALYVHPVIRGDELALSAAIQAGKISQPTETLESRHRAEAELRSVFTMFIKAIISPRITGMKEVDEELFKTLGDIMHVTSRELDRYSGHLRQFIVDDKGVVLIATFGLRGSTFPNMVANNCLPATFAIHQALKSELKVENRIGATFGKVYCGVVGGVRRHEFAVMGAPVNLAARLMSSKVNKGILVDEAVKEQAGTRFAFRQLPPVEAKGYDKPVSILEPLHVVHSKKKKSSFPFIGRSAEKVAITSVASAILQDPMQTQSSMVFLMGESGMGKSALALAVMEDVKKMSGPGKYTIAAARSTSTETEQKIPLISYRKVFLSLVRDNLEVRDGLEDDSERKSLGSKPPKSSLGLSLRSLPSSVRRVRSLGQSSRSNMESDTSNDEHRPSLTRSRGLKGECDFIDPSENPDEANMEEEFNQSLRNISEDLLPPESKPHEAGKKYLPNSLSLSHHVHDFSQSEGLSPFSGTTESLALSGHHAGSMSDLLRPKSVPSNSLARSPIKSQSMRFPSRRNPTSSRNMTRDDSSTVSTDASLQRNLVSVPYFEKLCWVCEQLNYPYEYADIVGSQFLGLESASPVTHIDGHIPTMDELVEFLALAFICIADFADLTLVVLDDFQWVDTFSWKIFRVLCKRGKKMLLVCATRSHDKQALRRMSTAVTRENQLLAQTMEISLGPLDFTEIRELTAAVLGHDKSAVSESVCADIFQRTGGLPVYVLQVLENIKRKKTLELMNGVLEWNAEGKKEKRAATTSSNGAVMEETFLSRFDTLDVRVRKVLQTCGVLGLSFALTDVIQVHPEMDEADIENALDTAVDEMILVEQVEEENDENGSLRSGSTSGNSGGDSDGVRALDDRFFQFSHAMWRKNVLTTMLKERKIELHRLIAESMEKDQVLILDQSDISRLLTLFEHWKACGDFCKSAPLALAVGARLEEWDLSAQSLELYEDALELSYDSVQPTSSDGGNNSEWVQVKARPIVLDLILRLHICIGLCHQRLGDGDESVLFFEDAYNIIKTSSKVPGMSRALMMPVISSLCVLKLEQDSSDSKTKREQEKLLERFVEEATENGNPVHICRALALEATRCGRLGEYMRSLEHAERIESMYVLETHSADMIAEYGRDFALECLAESVQWLYLLERHDDAEKQADLIIDLYIPKLEPSNTDDIMFVALPVIEVLKLLNRAKDADWVLKKFVINPFHEYSAHSKYWTELFNPLAYLLEVISMEETEQYDAQVLEQVEIWVQSNDNAEYSPELERRAHTYMGELCWRLAYMKDDDNPVKGKLLEKARELLEPVARYAHYEMFAKHTAQALLEAL